MLKESILYSLKRLLPAGQVFIDRTALIAYEVDAGLDRGLPEAVVFPRTTEEVQRIAQWAAQYDVPLIARGAGTGLSGGAVADRGGIIVEFSHMNRIRELDQQGHCALVEPALINLRLDEQARAVGLYFPPDPASQRASTIGGNVAENSGGPHCFKYGVTTNYIHGLTVVLADGSCIHTGGRAFDYPEYDLCSLLTGSEGMLGLITDITLRLIRNPPGVKTLLVAFNSVEHAGEAVSAVISAGLVPATMEMMDQRIIQIIEPFAHANLPLDAGAVLIVEVDGYPEGLDAQLLEVQQILRAYGGYAMRIAFDEADRFRIWLARKSAAGAIAREAPAQYTVDITVPRSHLAQLLTEVNAICDRYNLRVGHVFHAGDGNLHPLILIPEPDDSALIARVHAAGREMVKRSVELNGSLTGEHGVGIEKRQFMSLMYNAAELLALWDIKEAFDPDHLLNPGKVFPPPAADECGPYAGYMPIEQLLTPVPQEYATKIDGVAQYMPESRAEAARQLQALSQLGHTVTITSRAVSSSDMAGGMRWISTSGLCGVKEYAPDDFYITVGAGTPVSEIQHFLYEHNKQLPLVALHKGMTIGDLVAANINSPRRMRYGAVRDNVLCASVALADGRIIRSGRPIIKNVAGFDLTRIFIGSYGTLGLLTDISLKVLPLPRVQRSLIFAVADLTMGLRWGQKMLAQALIASAVILVRGYVSAELPDNSYYLVYSAEGMPEDVQAELRQVRADLQMMGADSPVEVDMPDGAQIWSDLLGEAVEEETSTVLVRIGVPVSRAARYVEMHEDLLKRQQGVYLVDFAQGFVYVRHQFTNGEAEKLWLQALRQPACDMGGYAVVLSVPEQMRGEIDRWGYQPEGLAVMRRLKARWDPRGILNPHALSVL